MPPFLLLLCILGGLVAGWPCPSQQCTSTPNLTCVASTEGTRCAECDWEGWLDGDTCHPDPVPRHIESCSNLTAPWCLNAALECVAAGYGVRCDECNFRGFLTKNETSGEIECACYDSRWNPHAHCTSRIGVAVTRATLTLTHTRRDCHAFQDPLLGCFANRNQTVQYGQPNPVVPNSCCDPIYGPPPGQLVESGVGGFQECNTYGTWDPNEPFAIGQFRTCSGHGTWDPDAYACVCDPKFNAVQIGTSVLHPGRLAYSCRTCFGFWGPLPPLDAPLDETTELFCSVPMTPGEDGEAAECGGHGDWIDGECLCHMNSLQGYWGLVLVQGAYIRVTGDGSLTEEVAQVRTCSVCYNAADSTTTGCMVSGLPPRGEETPQPTAGGCTSCRSFGKSVATGALIQLDGDPPLQGWEAGCCSVGTWEVLRGNEFWIYNGTCVESQAARRHFGSFTCQNLFGCVVYTAQGGRDGSYYYTFTGDRAFKLIPSAGSESGGACTPTASPVRPSTRFPTQAA